MTTNVTRLLIVLSMITACENASPPARRAVADQIALPEAITSDTSAGPEPEPRRDFAAGSSVRRPVASEMPAPTVPESTSEVIAQEITPGSMLVRVGQASLQVDSLDVGISRVRDVARRTGAIVANTSMEGGRTQTRAASLQLRIPSQRFDEAVNALSPIGKLESVNVTVQDVGEEFVDVQARVANAKRLEQRLVDLLAKRTGKLSDVLNVERELARVRQEIERYEGRMRYLQSRASVSTLTIAVHEPYPIVADRPGARPIRDAFVQAWRNFVGFLAGCIELLGILVPLAVICVLIAIVGRRVIPGVVPKLMAAKTAPDRPNA